MTSNIIYFILQGSNKILYKKGFILGDLHACECVCVYLLLLRAHGTYRAICFCIHMYVPT